MYRTDDAVTIEREIDEVLARTEEQLASDRIEEHLNTVSSFSGARGSLTVSWSPERGRLRLTRGGKVWDLATRHPDAPQIATMSRLEHTSVTINVLRSGLLLLEASSASWSFYIVAVSIFEH